MSGTIPPECVKDCTQPGQDAFADVEAWRRELNFEVPRDLAIRYLQEFGAWEDLQEAGNDTLAGRCLWIACGDIKEQGEWFGLIH